MLYSYDDMKNRVTNYATILKNDGMKQFINTLNKDDKMMQIFNDLVICSKNYNSGLLGLQVFLFDDYIGEVKTDLVYNTDRFLTKRAILEYLIMTDYKALEKFLKACLNINISLIGDANLSVQINNLSSFNPSFLINDEVRSVDGKTKYSIYSENCCIGVFQIPSNTYILNNKPLNQMVEVDSNDAKKYFLNNLKTTNDKYVESFQLKKLKSKNIK